MRRLAKQLSIYGSYHTKFITQLTHYIGVPLVVFSLLVLFNWVHISVPNVFDTSFAWFLTVVAFLYYLSLDVVFALVVGLVLILLNLIAWYVTKQQFSMLGLEVFLITFVVGWIFQFIGHFFEKKRPALFDNFWQFINAPIFLVAEIFFACGYKQKLQQQVNDLIAKKNNLEI